MGSQGLCMAFPPPMAQCRSSKQKSPLPSLSLKRGLFAYLQSFSQKIRLLIQHSSKSLLWSFLETGAGWVPSSCAPSTSLRVAGVPLNAHLWNPGFCCCYPEDTLFDSLVLVASRACVLGFNRFTAKEHFLTRYLSKAQQRGSRKKHLTHSFPERGLYAYLKLQSEG